MNDNLIQRDFYVQLMSNASTAEFPDNTANRFKNRLPYPLQLRESGWKVGISDISFPYAVRKLDLKDSLLFRIDWIEVVEPQLNLYSDAMIKIKERDLEFTPRTGTEFMNMIRDQYMWSLRDQSVSDLKMFKKKSKPDDPSFHGPGS